MEIKSLIKQLNQLGELDKIEAKNGKEAGKSNLETICAFSNEPGLGGGYLILGVAEERDQNGPVYSIAGVQNPEKIIEDLSSQCRSVFNKPISIEIRQEFIEDKVVIGVYVPEANPGSKPIFFKNQGLPQGAFRRVGSCDVKCTEDDLLILYENRNIESFDYTVLSDADFEDLDPMAVAEYRKEREAIHPNAEELRWSDEELLQSIGCLRRISGELKPTISGILLFGTQISIRKFFPSMRVDYIRESGNQWISDIENRFTSLEIRGPLINTIRRTLVAITDDLPKAFSLPEGTVQRNEIPIIPTAVIREAVVNALMHRNYRVHQSIQIIRYPNRIEIRNPGYSLIAEEHLGEPGSKSRNPKIAEALHETRFAEVKGSGIRIMRENMKRVGLSPPLFESNRNKDSFVATFLFHHFLNDEDLLWLQSFREYHLSDKQARALIFVREVGAIDNTAYRNLNHVDTLTASASLRHLRDLELLFSKNHGSATYYVPGQVFIDSLINPKEQTKEHMPEAKEHMADPKEHMPGAKEHKVGTKEDIHVVTNSIENLPDDLKQMINSLGKKANPKLIETIILALCEWKEMTSDELAQLLRRDKRRLTRIYLSPMVNKKLLNHKYPEMPKHPNQTYRTNKV